MYRNVIDVTTAEFTDEAHTIQLREAKNPFYGQWVEFSLFARAIPRGGATDVVWSSSASFAAQEIGYLWLAVIREPAGLHAPGHQAGGPGSPVGALLLGPPLSGHRAGRPPADLVLAGDRGVLPDDPPSAS